MTSVIHRERTSFHGKLWGYELFEAELREMRHEQSEKKVAQRAN